MNFKTDLSMGTQ